MTALYGRRLVFVALLVALGWLVTLVPSISDNGFIDLPLHLGLYLVLSLQLLFWVDDADHGVSRRSPFSGS